MKTIINNIRFALLLGFVAFGMTALAQVDSAVNVRAKPSTDSEIIGKIYNNCAAEILEVSEQDDGTWYLMKSGNVQGYIKAEFFLTGEEAEAKREEVGIKKGIVLSEDGAGRARLSALIEAQLGIAAARQVWSVEEDTGKTQ